MEDNVEIMKVGDITNKEAKPLRIVHISDTHLLHQDYLDDNVIPEGDVLVHSGDFSYFRFKRHLYTEYDYQEQIQQMLNFFDSMPHRYKIFVCGNHETNFPWHTVEQIQKDLQDILYLQDAAVKIEGVKFYGSPWCGKRWYSFARSFVVPYPDLHSYWEKIPDDVDVLVTHSPPFGVCDLAAVCSWQMWWQKATYCQHCQKIHDGWSHFGCKDLRARVFDISPKAHLFGHVHECNGFTEENGVLFSNAAMKLSDKPHVIDVYREYDVTLTTEPVIKQSDKNTGETGNKSVLNYCTLL